MAAAKNKPLSVVKDSSEFDINEWMDVKRHALIRNISWDDSQIKYSIKHHKKKPGIVYLSIYFRKKTLKMIDGSHDPRIMVMQNRNDPYRIMMTKSSNGYRVGNPDKQGSINFIKCMIKLPSVDEARAVLVEPIFHEKGFSSGAIIEFKIEK